MTDTQRLLAFAVATLLVLVFIAIPPVIALARRHPERRTIAKLAPLSVILFILWGALLAWAASDKRDDAVIGKYVAKLRERNLLPWIVGGLVAVGAIGGWVAMARV